MRTTIDLPDNLFRRAKARAALDGTTLKDLMTRFVEEGLQRVTGSPPGPPERQRSELPLVRAATGRSLPDLTHADLYAILEEDEVTRGRTG